MTPHSVRSVSGIRGQILSDMRTEVKVFHKRQFLLGLSCSGTGSGLSLV